MASKIFPAILIGVVVWLGMLVWNDSSEGLRERSETPSVTVKLAAETDRPEARDFTLTGTDGERIRLSDLRGGGPVILNFFATWCPGCNQELPHIAELYRTQREKGLQVVVVSTEPMALLRDFASQADLPFALYSDPDRKVTDTYGVDSLPFTLLIDREGRVATGLLGYEAGIFSDEFVPAVEELLRG